MAHAYNFRDAVGEGAKVPKAGPKVLKHIKVEKGSAGGHVVTHEFEYNHGPGPNHPDETYPFGEGDGAKMLAHVGKHMGVKVPAPAPTPAPQPGANSLEG